MPARTYCTETRAEEGEELDEYWRLITADGEINAVELDGMARRVSRNTSNWGDQAGESRYLVTFAAGGFPALANYHSQANRIGRSLIGPAHAELAAAALESNAA